MAGLKTVFLVSLRECPSHSTYNPIVLHDGGLFSKIYAAIAHATRNGPLVDSPCTLVDCYRHQKQPLRNAHDCRLAPAVDSDGDSPIVQTKSTVNADPKPRSKETQLN